MEHTDRANDAGAAMVLLGLVINVQITLPLQLGAVREVVESVTHLVGWYVFLLSLFPSGSVVGSPKSGRSGCGGRVFRRGSGRGPKKTGETQEVR